MTTRAAEKSGDSRPPLAETKTGELKHESTFHTDFAVFIPSRIAGSDCGRIRNGGTRRHFIRSMYTSTPNHEPGLFMMNSGSQQPIRPSLGSWLTYGLGTENQNLPGFVVLCPGKPVVGPALWSNSFLPGIFQRSRTPEIMGDAAYAILTKPSRVFTGNFCIDDELLRSEGVTDFDKYQVTPGVELLPDFFI